MHRTSDDARPASLPQLRDNHRVSVPYTLPPDDPTEVLGRRFAALAIDLIVLGVVGFILVVAAKHKVLYDAPPHACSTKAVRGWSICRQVGSHVYLVDNSALVRAGLLGALAGFLDLVVLQSLMGGSIGKLCAGLRVIEASGHEARFLRMLGRWVFLIVDLGCFVVGLVTTLVTHPHRRIGDLVCGTYVVGTAGVGQPVIVAPRAAPAFGAPPPGYAVDTYPAGWGGPAGAHAPPVETPPGTAPTTPGAWGAVARPAPFVRSPQWQAPPPGTPESAPEPRQTMAPQWATPPGPSSEEPERQAANEPAAETTAKPEEIVAQWRPVVPLANNAGTPLAAPVRTDPPAPAPGAAVSQWKPIVPGAPPNGAATPGEPAPTPPPPPTPPAPPPPSEPPPAPPTEPPPPPPAAEEAEDEVPWWDA
jgi:hypothetical protein